MIPRRFATSVVLAAALIASLIAVSEIRAGNAESRALTFMGPPDIDNYAVSRSYTLISTARINTAVSRSYTLIATPTTRTAVSRAMTVKYCRADVNGDMVVDVSDLLELLADWGTAGTLTDLQDDGTVDVSDLLLLLAAWGPCP
jgi:hypothetical protein